MSNYVTVAALASLLQEWPQHGANGERTVVLLGDRFPDLAARPMPAVTAGALEHDDGGRLDLCLFPACSTLPIGSTGEHAAALDLAAAALRYSFATPAHEYDHDRASELALRAVAAIERIQRLKRSLTL